MYIYIYISNIPYVIWQYNLISPHPAPVQYGQIVRYVQHVHYVQHVLYSMYSMYRSYGIYTMYNMYRCVFVRMYLVPSTRLVANTWYP